uniref:Solute carrier family 15 member 2 n=1 Tax=Electrophorus electricus TaxID=8005 RepID=A0A4W4GMV8_ELEEL
MLKNRTSNLPLTLQETLSVDFLKTFFLQKICGTNYPVSIGFIVVNEFCERFSYYGMKAVLTLYFINYLQWNNNLSTAVYHAFSSLCYFTPLLGALIADSWLGKFRTIIYLSVVYVIGHVVKSVGAIPDVGDNTLHITLSMLGLGLIAFGTGGIKPCVAAFGGDQFEEEHTEERTKFFSIFYMSINAGSVLSTIITPILRSDVQCFGGDCYALAFGVPAALMLVALVVFIAGSGMYKKNPREGNVLVNVCRCIGFAIHNRWWSPRNSPRREHWLDWAQEKYPKQLIQEIKMVLRVLALYIPLPMFWALFDQQGSRWTLQATRMNMDFVSPLTFFGSMLNALMILLFIPVFDMGVYPLVSLCRVKLTPLRKMTAGMVLAALAFAAATVVELNVIVCQTSKLFQHSAALFTRQLLLSLTSLQMSLCLQDPLGYTSLPLNDSHRLFQIAVTHHGMDYSCDLNLTEHTAYSLVIHSDSPGITYSISDSKQYNIDLGLLDFGASYTVILQQDPDNLALKKMEDVQANDVHIAWQIPQYVLLTAGEVMFSITGLEFSYSQAPVSMKSVLQAGWLMTVAFGNVIVLIVAEGAGLEQWMEFLLFAALLIAVSGIFSIMAYFYTYVDPGRLGNEDAGNVDVLKKEKESICKSDTPKSTRI